VRAVEQALAYGVKVFGVTVHFVDEGVDTGPIILQRAIELPDATDPAAVHDALRPVEHDLLCAAILGIARGAVAIDPRPPAARPDGAMRERAPEVSSPPHARTAMTQPGEVRVRRAILSVSTRRRSTEFARGLAELGVELCRPAARRRAARGGLEVRDIEDFTGFPEIMGGRVKTLHPKLYAGCSRSATTRRTWRRPRSTRSSSSISCA
jgi:hypothetical protein